ncbi:MAG TPA: hypothetical protein DIT07_12520 [Sphingobacteriaceae bacterium]|nr:hypothetical protein [Sphingobacteriaceae bacterium]
MRIEDFIEEWYEIIPRLVSSVGSFRKENILKEDIFHALFIKYSDEPEYEFPTDMYHFKPDYDSLFEYLKEFQFEFIKEEFETSSGDIHYSHIVRYKATIKSNGIVWRLHKFDKDDFPSSPHAHNIDSNLKLHLGNGKVFKKKQQVGTIPYKEFATIRDKFISRGFELPKLE